MKGRVILAPLAAVAAASVCLAQTPSAADLLARYEQALGGKTAIEKLTTRVSKGTMEIPDDNTHAPFEIYQKAPGKYFLFVNDPDNGKSWEALSGPTGWTQDPDSGFHEMTDQELIIARRDHDFYREIQLARLFPTMKVTGKERTGAGDAWVMEASAADGATEKLYFDATSGFLLERDYERVDMDSGIVMNRIFYGDYRKVDGVTMPFTIRQSTPDDERIFHFEDIQVNVPVADSQFDKPAAVNSPGGPAR